MARDTRISGVMLENALVSGLMAAGVNVSVLGMIPTPALAYLTKSLEADVGFMLTASHNPPQYNGIKVFSSDSLSFTDDGQEAVEKIVNSENFALADWRSVGTASGRDAAQAYVDMVSEAAALSKRWRVAVDPGCGATFNVAPAILGAVGCKVVSLNAQADGYFPARKSEPTAESLQDLSRVVKALNVEVGVAFDGDGDRAAFVDEAGEFVDFDRALAGYSAYVLKSKSGGTVVTNVEASMCVETMAKKYGGKVVRTRVGDVYVSQAMKRKGAVFGGEPCGAWVHPEFHWCPDGPLSAVLMLKALEQEGKSLREFIADVPQYVTLRENLPVSNDLKLKAVGQIERIIRQSFSDYTDFSTVDGIRLAFKDGWMLIRASGTEPLIRLTVEGESLKAANAIMQKGTELVKEQIGNGQK